MDNNYRETSEYIYFYGSFFSQWASYTMIIDEIEYNCCEQYMMAEKARLFKDDYALKQIMKTNDPAVQKKWGKKVKNFDREEWEKIAKEVVFKANYAKFTQHKGLKEKLLSTGDKVIVEASPWDCIWGVGLRAYDRRILDPENWRGTNWLGEVIMKVREKLLDEQKE